MAYILLTVPSNQGPFLLLRSHSIIYTAELTERSIYRIYDRVLLEILRDFDAMFNSIQRCEVEEAESSAAGTPHSTMDGN